MKKRCFGSGGEVGTFVDPTEASSVESSNSSSSAPASVEAPSTFKEAFASARRAGLKTFSYGGKRYTTDVAAPKTSSRPAAERTTAPAEFGPSFRTEVESAQKRVRDARAGDPEESPSLAAMRRELAARMHAREAAAAKKKAEEAKDRYPIKERPDGGPKSKALGGYEGVNPKTLLPYKAGGAVKGYKAGGAVKPRAMPAMKGIKSLSPGKESKRMGAAKPLPSFMMKKGGKVKGC